jgi:hypothetical protein
MPGRSRNNRVPNKKHSMFSGFPNFSKGTRKPVPVNSSKNTNNISTKETTNEPIKVVGPGIGDSIKTGFGFGIGSAIAHTGVNTAINSLGGKYVENTNTSNEETNTNNSVNVCSTIFKQYTDCLSRYGNDTYHPECIEVRKVLDTLQCPDINTKN